jgi:hypothetical protein
LVKYTRKDKTQEPKQLLCPKPITVLTTALSGRDEVRWIQSNEYLFEMENTLML